MQFCGQQCSAVQCTALYYNAVECSAVQCIAVHIGVVQCSVVQCSAAQCSAVQQSKLYCSAECRVLCAPELKVVKLLLITQFIIHLLPHHSKGKKRMKKMEVF